MQAVRSSNNLTENEIAYVEVLVFKDAKALVAKSQAIDYVPHLFYLSVNLLGDRSLFNFVDILLEVIPLRRKILKRNYLIHLLVALCRKQYLVFLRLKIFGCVVSLFL